jgi:hypothetical protein
MYLCALSFALIFAAGTINGPADLDRSFQDLKQAQANHNAAQVKALAISTYAAAKDIAASPAPSSADEKDAWKQSVDYAKYVELQIEYVLSTTAAEGKPDVTVDLLSTLEQLNPSSKYLDAAYGRYFYALGQTGATAKIAAVAEKGLARFPGNDDCLLVLADSAMSRKQPDKAIGYAERLVNVLNKRGKPEGLSAADWQKKKDTALGRGYFIAGVLRAEKNQFYQANENLRAALPLIRSSQAMMPPALFYLGLANYQLGKQMLNKAQVREAAKFSEQAAAYGGPLADQARHNALVMNAEADRMR